MKRLIGLTSAALVSGLVLLAGGCGLPTDGDREDLLDLQAAERRWAQSGVQDYQIIVQQLCFCGYTRPVRITVRLGNVVSRVDAESGEPVPQQGENAREVRGLFALVRDAIDRDAHSMSVTYDATYGIPLQINIDYIANTVDDELTVRASEFQPLR
ncbi:MAG: DUF6174 domain-containing protein [Gemmatimonadaceae bacterium]